MIYLVDTHVLIWSLDDNPKLKQRFRNILADASNEFLYSVVTLAEIRHLIWVERVKLNFSSILSDLNQAENCILYPVDQEVILQMPLGLNIHDAMIVGTGLAYRKVFKQEVAILTEDAEIIASRTIPIA